MKTDLKNILIINIVLLIITLFIFENTEIDLKINDLFYNKSTHSWIIQSNDSLSGYIFYKGAKILLVLTGITILILIILSFFKSRIKHLRKKAIFLFTCMAIIPSFVAFLKHTTNIYPPWDLSIYNGDKPYIKLFASYPEDFHQTRKAQGYPAGHASGGFSILCFYFLFKKKYQKRLFLILWLSAGWSMGIYQMLRGAHFLSHTIVSNLISVIMTIFIYKIFINKFPEDFQNEIL